MTTTSSHGPAQTPADRHAAPPLTVETTGLSRAFRGRAVVRDVSLRVRSGRTYGLLGPNGAGKSTTLKMLLGLLAPSAGRVQLFGEPFSRAALRRVGASIEGPSLYGHLSARQNLRVHTLLLGLGDEHAERALEQVGLTGTGRARARSFSTGMKGRLALATALLGDPDLLVLDEPQNGLDPEGIAALRQLVSQRTSDGGSVVVSSHLLAEVAHVADDIGLIVDGRLLFQGTAEEFAPDGDLERAYFTRTSERAA